MKLELRSLRVINCGPLRDVCIHFNTEGKHPITVLAGANGSGKTTVLELVSAFAEMLNPYRDKQELPDSLSNATYAQLDWLIDGKIFSTYCGAVPPDANIAADAVGWDINDLHMRKQIGNLASVIGEAIHQQEGQTTDFYDAYALYREKGRRVAFSGLPSIMKFPHNRFMEFVQGDQLQREETVYQWLYCYKPSLVFKESLDSYLIWLEYAEPEKYAKVIEFLNGLDFDGKTFSIVRRELKAIVTTRDGQRHRVDALSSGEQNILIMLLELRRRLLPGSIVLIDEIENSLHPAFQRRVAEALMRLQEMVPFQLIVTTHSPTFVDIFGTGSTRILTEF